MAERFNYGKMRSTAERLLERFGQTGLLRRKGGAGASSPWNPAAASEQDFPVTFVLTEYSVRERSTSLIQLTDKRAYISTKGVGISPSVGDRLVTEDLALAIVTLSPLSPGGVVLFWEAQVRL